MSTGFSVQKSMVIAKNKQGYVLYH